MPATHEAPQAPLGVTIRNRREELGLSKAEAARRAGIGRGTWHEVENGTRTNMMPETLNLIDQALGWEKGHLRRLARPLETHPAITWGETRALDGSAVITEVKPNLDGDGGSLRRQLIAFAQMLDLNKLQLVIDYITELEITNGSPSFVTQAEFERFRKAVEGALVKQRKELPTVVSK